MSQKSHLFCCIIHEIPKGLCPWTTGVLVRPQTPRQNNLCLYLSIILAMPLEVKIWIHHYKGYVARCEASNDGVHEPRLVLLSYDV